MSARSACARSVAIVTTGTANLASVQAAFSRLGAQTTLTCDPRVVETSEYVVVPGVGTLGAAMQTLHEKDLSSAVVERVAADRPTMGICVGMQIFGLTSEESPGAAGLGIVPAHVRRLPGGQRVPHMGWNRVEPLQRSEIVQPGYAYFANSYCFLTEEAGPALAATGWQVSCTTYGVSFISAIRRGKVLACQFHPELSGSYGAQLLARWLDNGKANP